MSFSDCVFNLHGIPLQEQSELTTLIKNNGGAVSTIFSSNTTHLLTTPELLKENGYKVKSAKKSKVQVITPNWIHERATITPTNLPTPTQTSYSPLSSPLGSPISFTSPSSPTKSPSKPSSHSRRPKSHHHHLTIFKETKRPLAPSVNLVLPNRGSIRGTYQLALFGLNFKATKAFHIKIGKHICTHVEYHCSTSVLVTIHADEFTCHPGVVTVNASNNNGTNYGMGAKFVFYDDLMSLEPSYLPTDNHKILQSQLENLKRSIAQLETGMHNVQQLEYNISRGLNKVGGKIDFDKYLIEDSPLGEDNNVRRTHITTAKPGNALPSSHTAPKRVQPRKVQKQVIASPADDDSVREIKIFISSPFRDMNGERDMLVKGVMPKLRKLCSERDVVLSYVDLRWGITENQTENAATLLMCLREINKSSVFLGLYGERYGWCLSRKHYSQPTTTDNVLQRSFQVAEKDFPWIADYKDKSVTEIEMRMILDKHYSGPQKAAWFYFRDPYFIENVPDNEKPNFVSEGEHEAHKLAQLKSAIGESEFPSAVYNRPSHLEELILEDLVEYVNLRYPQGVDLPPLKRERFKHTCYARNLTRTYLPIEKYFMSLDKHASSNTTTPLVIEGVTGIGKSALLANWSSRYREHHPEAIVIEHWIGCGGAASNYFNLLLRVMNELQDILGDFTEDIPKDSADLEKSFPGWLEKTLKRNQRHKLVLIIDGLDVLENTRNSHALLWLPRQFPPQVRVVLSVEPGSRPFQTVLNREWETLTIAPLQEAERISFIRQFLNLHSKKLTAAQEFKIAKPLPSGNPRYLKTLLEDIIVSGNFEELDSRIARDLRARDSAELYEILLERLEKDYDKDKKGTVEHFMLFLEGSRRGLYIEGELNLLMEGKNIEFATWNKLFLVIEDLLFNSGGLISFSNKDIRRAVVSRYLKSDSRATELHLELAHFFEKSTEGITDRKVDELPWQLSKAKEWRKLCECITDLRMFVKLFTKEYKFDLILFARQIEKHTSISLEEAYISKLSRGDSFPSDVIRGDVFYRVGSFFEEFAKYEGAIKVLKQARYQYLTSSQPMEVAKTDYAISRVLITLARFEEAEQVLLKTQDMYEKEKDSECLEVSHVLNRLGALYTEMNQYQKATEAFNKCLKIRKEKLGENHSRVGQTYKHLVTFYESCGKLQDALQAGEKALKITEAEFGPDHFQVPGILARLARIHMAQQKWDLAEERLKRALKIMVEKLGEDHPYTGDIKYELGCLYFVKPEDVGSRVNKELIQKFANKNFWQNKSWEKVDMLGEKREREENKKEYSLDAAEKWLKSALSSKEKAVGQNHPDVARILNRLGSLYIERVEFDTAEEYFKRALEIRVRYLGSSHSRVAQTYKHLLTLYQLQEKPEESIEAGLTALKISNDLRGEDSLQSANIIVRIGEVYATDNFDKAKEYYRKAIEIRKKRLGADHESVKQVEEMLRTLTIPPPPPPPAPTALMDVNELREMAAPEVSLKSRRVNARMDLLKEIENRVGSAKKKKMKILKTAKHVVQKNLKKKQGWWKQNYKYKKPRV